MAKVVLWEELLQESERDEAEIVAALTAPEMQEHHAAFERLIDRDETREKVEA